MSTRFLLKCAALAALFTPTLAAQRQQPVAVLGFDDVPAMLPAWEQTAVARLARHDEVAPAVQKVVEAYVRARRGERELVDALLASEGVALDPWEAYQLLQPELDLFGAHPLEDCRSAGFSMLADLGQEDPWPVQVDQVRPLPRVEGRWVMEFEQAAALRAGSPLFGKVADASAGGFPVQALRVVQPETEDFGDDFFRRAGWSLVSPGALTRGLGGLEGLPGPDDLVPLASLRPAGRDAGGFGARLFLDAYLKLFSGGAPRVPAEFHLVGFPSLTDLRWWVGCEGERLLDEIVVETAEERSGLVGALLAAAEAEVPPPMPRQPMPRGALAQLRLGLDVATLRKTYDDVLAAELGEMPEGLVEDLTKALTGGLALGVAAPAPGGMLPRIFASLGVADGEALARVLESLVPAESVRELELSGVACSVLRMDGMPQGLEPAWCVHDGQLHVAESGRSLKAFLAELTREGAPEAMEVGDAPVPQGGGELVGTFDLRLDDVAIYRAYLETWLPLFVLAQGADKCLVLPDEMPSVETVAEFCGTTRGVLRREGDTYRLQHLGVLGGPITMSLAMMAGPMLGRDLVSSYQYDSLAPALMRHRVEGQIWPAFEAFRKDNGRAPESLAELVRSGLAAEALLIPGDDLAEPIEGVEGARTSFRYYPVPQRMESFGETVEARFAAIRARYQQRVVVTDDGQVSAIYTGDLAQVLEVVEVEEPAAVGPGK